AADLEREARRLASTRNHALVTCHEVAGVPQVGPFYSGCRWSLAGEAHLFWGCPHRLGIRGPYAYDGSIRRGDEKPRGHLKKFGGSKLRDRRSATRQSGSESRTSGERAGDLRGTLSAKGNRRAGCRGRSSQPCSRRAGG